MAQIEFLNNFRRQFAGPLDTTDVAADESVRLGFPAGVVYKGMTTYQLDNDTLYVLESISQANHVDGWRALDSEVVAPVYADNADGDNQVLIPTDDSAFIHFFVGKQDPVLPLTGVTFTRFRASEQSGITTLLATDVDGADIDITNNNASREALRIATTDYVQTKANTDLSNIDSDLTPTEKTTIQTKLGVDASGTVNADSNKADKDLSNVDSDLTDDEKLAIRTKIGAGTGSGTGHGDVTLSGENDFTGTNEFAGATNFGKDANRGLHIGANGDVLFTKGADVKVLFDQSEGEIFSSPDNTGDFTGQTTNNNKLVRAGSLEIGATTFGHADHPNDAAEEAVIAIGVNGEVEYRLPVDVEITNVASTDFIPQNQNAKLPFALSDTIQADDEKPITSKAVNDAAYLDATDVTVTGTTSITVGGKTFTPSSAIDPEELTHLVEIVPALPDSNIQVIDGTNHTINVVYLDSGTDTAGLYRWTVELPEDEQGWVLASGGEDNNVPNGIATGEIIVWDNDAEVGQPQGANAQWRATRPLINTLDENGANTVGNFAIHEISTFPDDHVADINWLRANMLDLVTGLPETYNGDVVPANLIEGTPSTNQSVYLVSAYTQNAANSDPAITFAVGSYTYNGTAWVATGGGTGFQDGAQVNLGIGSTVNNVAIATVDDVSGVTFGTDPGEVNPIAEGGNNTRWPTSKLPIGTVTEQDFIVLINDTVTTGGSVNTAGIIEVDINRGDLNIPGFGIGSTDIATWAAGDQTQPITTETGIPVFQTTVDLPANPSDLSGKGDTVQLALRFGAGQNDPVEVYATVDSGVTWATHNVASAAVATQFGDILANDLNSVGANTTIHPSANNALWIQGNSSNVNIKDLASINGADVPNISIAWAITSTGQYESSSTGNAGGQTGINIYKYNSVIGTTSSEWYEYSGVRLNTAGTAFDAFAAGSVYSTHATDPFDATALTIPAF